MDVFTGGIQELRVTAAWGAGSRDCGLGAGSRDCSVFSDPREGASQVEVWGEERSRPGEGTARQRP